MSNIGSLIRKARKSKGLTQSELAMMIDKSLSTVQKYELNKVVPTMDVLFLIIDALDIEPDSFFLSIGKNGIITDVNKSIEDYYEKVEQKNALSFLLNHSYMIEWLKSLEFTIEYNRVGFIVLTSKNGVSRIMEYSDLYELYSQTSKSIIEKISK